MRTIEVLGSGCPNCRRLEANAREAVAMEFTGHVVDGKRDSHGLSSHPV